MNDDLFNYVDPDVQPREEIQAQIEPDICERRHKGNPESREAHKRVSRSGRAAADRVKILEWIERRGDGTCDEAEIDLGLPHQSCSARFSELKRDGRLIPTGEKRKTRSGTLAAVMRRRNRE